MTDIKKPHTKDECLISAKKYASKAAWSRFERALYAYAYRNGWMEECCAHMKKSKYNTKEECMESAKHYSSRKEWRIGNRRSYESSRMHGWLDECCAHMDESTRSSSHTLDECMESAKKFDSKYDWLKANNKLYNYAKSHGWMGKCLAHMSDKGRIYGRTKDDCIRSAFQYKTIEDWRHNDNDTYKFAQKHRWIRECCAHMTKNNSKSISK